MACSQERAGAHAGVFRRADHVHWHAAAGLPLDEPGLLGGLCAQRRARRAAGPAASAKAQPSGRQRGGLPGAGSAAGRFVLCIVRRPAARLWRATGQPLAAAALCGGEPRVQPAGLQGYPDCRRHHRRTGLCAAGDVRRPARRGRGVQLAAADRDDGQLLHGAGQAAQRAARHEGEDARGAHALHL